MITSKKSQMNAVVIMILVVIVAIILLVVGQKIFTKYTAEGAIETCRLSVLAQARTELVGTSVLSLDCKRRYIDIYDDHVAIGNEPDNTKTAKIMIDGTQKNRYNTLTSDVVNYVIAEEMKTCWYQFGEAKTEIFPNNEPITEGIGLADDDICFTCSEIEFIDIKNKKFTGLINYTKNMNIKDKKYTYWEYLNQNSLSEHNLDTYINDCYTSKIEKLWNNEPFVFNSEQTYAVIFYKDYDDSVSNLLKFGIPIIGQKMLLGKIVGTIISPTCTDDGGKSGYYVFVLPMSNLDELCEIQAS